MNKVNNGLDHYALFDDFITDILDKTIIFIDDITILFILNNIA